MPFTKNQIDLICYGREERHLEYKGSLEFSNDASKALVARAIAAHSNARDGGDIIVGMEKCGESYSPSGVTPAHLATFKSDELRDYIQVHFLPMPNFKMDIDEFEGKSFIIISVSPFGLYPCVCVQGYCEKGASRPTLTKGIIYVRSKRKPESAPLETEEDLAELIDTSADRWLQYRARRDKTSSLVSPEDSRKGFESEGSDL